MIKISLSLLLAAAVLSGSAQTTQSKLLSATSTLLERGHYLHPVVNDEFSEGIWDTYINNLDTRKYVFLEEDIAQLKAYQHTLDNELHGDSVRFFPAAAQLFARRYDEAAATWRKLLTKPFPLHDKDSICPDQRYTGFAANTHEREQRWRRYLQQRILEQLVTLQQQRKQSKPADSLHQKTDQQLEQMARNNLLRQQERLFNRFHATDNTQLFANYLNAILHYTDPHSDYFPPVDKAAFDQGMANRFYGIGVQLREDEEGNVSVTGVDAGGPASKSGMMMTGDRIIKVGQGNEGPFTEVEGMGIAEVVKLIRGEKGTTVRIGCRRPDGSIAIAFIVREEIKPEESAARSAIITANGKKTGYIYLPVFYDDFAHADGAHCADDVEKELTKLMVENIDHLIIDLRNNGGGSLAQVIKMVGLFTGRGPVVQVKAGNGQLQVLSSEQPEALYKGPLTVMVNELSASASEIFAAAIQDYQRGMIIGSATLGKGTVQRTIPLETEAYGAIKLTIQKFYRINGGSTQLKGVLPDVLLPDSYETMEVREAYRPFAMGWDMIEPADYTVKSGPGWEQLVQKADSSGHTDKRFATIARYNTMLEKYHEVQGHSLLQKQYKEQMLQRTAISRQFAAIVVLPEAERLTVSNTKKQWADKLAADIYIRQAVLNAYGK